MALISGQKTVTTAGTAVQIGTIDIRGPLLVKALDTNTGVVAVGNDGGTGGGDVTVSNGLRLLKGETIAFQYVGSLTELWLDSAVSGEGISWIKLNPSK